MRRILSVGLLIVLAIAGLASIQASSAARERSLDERNHALTHELVAMHHEAALVLIDELNTAVLVGLGEESPTALGAATRMRQAVLGGISQDIAAVAEPSTINASHIATFSGFLEDVAGYDPATADIRPLWGFALSSLAGMEQIAAPEDRLASLSSLHEISLAPHFVLNVALDAAIATSQDVGAANQADYWSDAAGFLADGAEQLNAQADDPIPEWADPARSFYATEVTMIGRALVSSGIHDYDRWIATWADGEPGPAPMSLDELRLAVLAQADAFDDLTTTIAADLQLKIEAAADADLSDQRLFRVVAVVAIGSAAALAMWILLGASQRRRLLSLAATTDPLTGVGNRRLLDTTVRSDLNNQTYEHNLIAMMDIDRFKMVNDGWGHAAGDAALVAVAHRLRAAMECWESEAPRRRATIVRLGGDEFMVAAHSATPSSTTGLTGLIRSAVERPVPQTDQHDIPIEISLGFAECPDAKAFDDALRAADLAAYEDKARRRPVATDTQGAYALELMQ